MEDFEKELLNAGLLADACDDVQVLEIGCRKLNLINEEEHLLGLFDCSPWKRGGAESYITSGTLSLSTGGDKEEFRKVIVKAYVGFGASPETRVETWKQRAIKLDRHNVPVSRVYSTFKGVLFSQFIEWSLTDYLKTNASERILDWAGHLLSKIANSLDALKVHPVSLLPDLRTDGVMIYLVDFGEDLGEVPGQSEVLGYCSGLIQKELCSYGFNNIAELLVGGAGHYGKNANYS